MFGKYLFISCLVFAHLLNVECGIWDWFRPKPSWAKYIDKVPLIEAFTPKGLRVSISDVAGMEVFGFHGKLNHCFKRGEEGDIYGNVTKPTNGRWVFINENIELKLNDALHFWVYVKFNGEEYSFSKNVFIIRNAAPLPGDLHLPNDIDERIGKRQNTLEQTIPGYGEKLCKCPMTPNSNNYPYNIPNQTPNVYPVPQDSSYTNQITTYSPVPNAGVSTSYGGKVDLRSDDVSVTGNNDEATNLASELMACSFQVDSLNEVILDLLKDKSYHSKLVLTGKVETNLSAIDEVKKFLVQYLELYDLGKKIKTAEFGKCGIYIEMSSIIDKQRILSRAKTDMKNTPCKFVEPELAVC